MGKKLAIKGHSTRGKEVIELLEMMGGKHSDISGSIDNKIYYIDDNRFLSWDFIGDEEIDKYKIFTLEEFIEKFPFKIGDKVLIPEYESEVRICRMSWDGFEIQYKVYRNDEEEWYTAEELLNYNDDFLEDNHCNENQVNGMKNVLSELYEHIKTTPKEELEREFEEIKEWSNVGPTVEEFMTFCECKTIGQGTYAIKIVNGYKFDSIDENGNIIVKPIKPKFPTTYEECWKVRFEVDGETTLGEFHNVSGYYSGPLGALQKLLCCRDAYWKIAGEQMGLDGHWKPDWENYNEYKYCLYITENNVNKGIFYNDNHILTFPTEEMRDAFYENFKDLIEDCKELL